MNEEFLVNPDHQSAVIRSLSFGYTTRDTYSLNDLMKPPAYNKSLFLGVLCENLFKPFHLEEGEFVIRGGEPTEGSLSQ